jgi:RNA polymerase sigma factor (sigma-70 family)
LSSADFHSQSSATESTTKPEWSLTKQAFDKLLCSLAADRDEAATQYEVLRRKLVRFFEWRAVESPDERADETINRVARRIDEGQTIENLRSYSYGVARMVFMEAIKERDRAPVYLDDAPQGLKQTTPEAVEPDARLLCLDQCLDSLTPDNRTLIVAYYQEERRAKIQLRQELADRLQIPLNALRIRAHRIRMSLEKCITTCLQTPAVAK